MGNINALVKPGHNCWQTAQADHFALIVDAADYFVAAREAMLKARKNIYLIGWDFDSRIPFGSTEHGEPEQLGDFILWLAKRTPSLEIRLLRWDTGAFKSLLHWHSLATILRWKAHPRITLKLDGAHPVAGSHHQKILVIDDSLAFCGGIDMTSGRWDLRDHADNQPERTAPDGTACDPWHDATSAFDGTAAHALGDLARERWHAATGEQLLPSQIDHPCWPDSLQPIATDTPVSIARTWPERQESPAVHEIENLYLDLIANAQKLIYAESQYFASRKIAHAIALRLAEENGPEVVIINPLTAEGWLEPIAMDSARAQLVEALQRIDHKQKLRLYHPQTAGEKPIYVHAKIMIVDDCYLRIGSSNFNNRSLRLDTECDILLTADQPDQQPLRATLATIRHDLVAEHLGVSVETVTDTYQRLGSLIKTIEALRGTGRTLIPYQLPELSNTAKWLADNEILDPEGPDAIFEPLDKRGLFKGWRGILKRHG